MSRQARRATSVGVLQRIRQLVIDRCYYLSAHAEEEMWADGLEGPDIEQSILRGRIEKKMKWFVNSVAVRLAGKRCKICWFRRKLYIVDDVEAKVCQECGERYYHATTLDAIDQLLESGCSVVKEQLQVQVIGMSV
jgi:YgiT-type zinc finger domain-containing protein